MNRERFLQACDQVIEEQWRYANNLDTWDDAFELKYVKDRIDEIERARSYAIERWFEGEALWEVMAETEHDYICVQGQIDYMDRNEPTDEEELRFHQELECTVWREYYKLRNELICLRVISEFLEEGTIMC